MEKATSKLRKKLFSIEEQACHEIHDFGKLFQELQDKIVLSGQSKSTLNNYALKLAQVSLYFGKPPQHISEKEINRYLALLARKSETPSLSDFKFAVFGLRYHTKHICSLFQPILSIWHGLVYYKKSGHSPENIKPAN
ncbi:MAG: phage integrase N-terminal SAM-like domain-containing protein [Bacteroidetes bacterium]|nr:phage integrase N-terminal SAM-like domain-containing protein [Bacteroidota bacterium]